MRGGTGERPVTTALQPALPGVHGTYQLQVPSGEAWRVLSVRMTGRADATVVNRVMAAVIDIDGVEVWGSPTDVVATANQSWELNCMIGGGPSTVRPWAFETLSNFAFILIPDMILPAGAMLQLAFVSWGPGDAWTNLFASVEKYFIGEGM